MTMATPKTSAAAGGKPKQKIRYFRLRNRLNDKAGIGISGGGGFAVEALEEAMKEIAKFSDDYPDFVAGYLKKLFALHKACAEKDEENARGTFARSTTSRMTCAAKVERSDIPSSRRSRSRSTRRPVRVRAGPTTT